MSFLTDNLVPRWLQYLARQQNFQVEFENATEDMGVLSIAGPRSWDLLKKLTTQDVSKFPFLSAKQVGSRIRGGLAATGSE